MVYLKRFFLFSRIENKFDSALYLLNFWVQRPQQISENIFLILYSDIKNYYDVIKNIISP